MRKEDGTSFGSDDLPGDVEMVAGSTTDASTDDGFDDEFDDQGYSMGAGTGRGGRSANYSSQNGNGSSSSGRKYLCCLVLVVMAVCILAVTYVFAPEFGLSLSGNDNDADGSSSMPGTVAKDSIIHNDAYDIILTAPVETVEGDLLLYQHKKTKTPVMIIIPYDTEQDSVFGISYRTKPSNSHGAPHVLEHSVLAGSKKYPIKDPFTQVLKGSLNTFVNAMTMDDLTAYICASRNDVDMKNLMSVYMDAVFQPLVVEEEGNLIFRQEGWRVEMNETGEPEFNGVVLSEMKGAMSSPDEILGEYSKAQMFPNISYRFNSGGEPKVIPDLTHAELIEFYNTFYHPSNAQVMLYGTKVSAKNCLEQLDEYLVTYEPRPDIRNKSKIDLQPPLNIPDSIQRVPYASDEDDGESHQVMMSWLVSKNGVMDEKYQRENRLAYAVLDELLMNDKYGVLYQAIQTSGLGGSISGGCSLDMQQWTFEVLVTNVNATNVQELVDLVRNALQTIVDQGISQEYIESAMNTVEFNNRDISSANYPRGILIWMKVMETWKFDLDPLAGGFLSFETDLAELKQRVQNDGSDVFVDIVRDHIVNNHHRAVMELFPDPTLAQKNEEEEQERLVKLRKSQSFPGLLDEADSLAERQVTDDPPELLALIPSVTVDDLAKHGYEPPVLIDEDHDGSGVTVLIHEVASSFGIVYVDFGVDISTLDFEDVILVPVLASMMLEAGTEKYNEDAIAREIGTNTGGISEQFLIQPILPPNATSGYLVPDGEHFHTKLCLHGAAAKEKGEKLLELISQIMFKPLLDSQERALAILRDRISELEQRLSTGGLRFPSRRLNARYKTFKFIDEVASGVSAIPKLRKLLTDAESDWGNFLARLVKMKDFIVNGNRKGMVLNLTGEKSVLQVVAPKVTHFLANELPERSQETPLPDFSKELHPWVPQAKQQMATESPPRNEGIVTTTKVNFVGAGAPFFQSLEAVPGSTAVVSQFIEYNNFMLQIRERRGAYGAFVTMDRWTGLLEFISYRDPNLSETLHVYETVPTYLKEQMENPATAIPLINSAIVGTIGSLDGSAPQPDSAGWESLLQWLSGSTPEIRQKWREEILKTDNNDFLEYALRLHSWSPTLSVSGPKSVLEKEKDLNMTLIDVL